MKIAMRIAALIGGASVLTVGLGGCGDGFNDTKLRQAVVDEFKTTEVVNVPGKIYTFVIRTKDGEIWIAETKGADAKVTAKSLLFAAR
jgi:hypothetical protein